MLFIRVLLFFILGTFTLAAPVSSAPVSSAPVSTHPHPRPPGKWRTITSSPQNDVIEQNFGERVADYWYRETDVNIVLFLASLVRTTDLISYTFDRKSPM